MPSMTMAEQTDNSCAAHCHVIAIAEMLGTSRNMTPAYAEGIVWPAIQFRTGENQGLTNKLATAKNADPRKVAKFADDIVDAKVKCDDVAKATALGFVDAQTQGELGGLFNLIKGHNATVTTAINSGGYYNCTFLMFNSAMPAVASFTGMHNILVTKAGSDIWYYNSNETNPAWVRTVGNDAWKVLQGQNAGTHSYVFTGVLVEMTI